MEDIRLATVEEIEKIRLSADLGPGCTILQFGKDTAVVRNVTEVDPVYFDESTTDRRKQAFIWGIETALRLQGVPFYYFNVAAEDEKFCAIQKARGCEQVSKVPELRFKKVL